MKQVVTHYVEESQVNGVNGTLMDSSPSSGLGVENWGAGGKD
jgi:hypothetical protein